MKEPSLEEFASALLAQDAWFDSPEHLEHRREVIRRLTRAAQREKQTRPAVVFAWVAGALVLAILCFLATREAVIMSWPDWIRTALALVFILTPVTMLLLLGIYLFRYRLELVRAKRQARQQALMELPKRLDQMRRELDELKAQGRKEERLTSPPTQGSSAFTLLELLVVIAILVILGAMLFPALSRGKSSAKTVLCKNNLSQMGKALVMYEADSRYFPGFGTEATKTNQPPYWFRSPESWVAKIIPYLSGNTNVFACPEYRLLPPYSGAAQSNPIFLANYGYNAGGSCKSTDWSQHLGLGHGNLRQLDGQVLNGDLIGLSGIKAPGDMIALGDLQLPPSVAHSVITPSREPIGAFTSVIPSRHAGGANMVFVDSHVEWSKQPRWVDETDHVRSRWNNDHQPHPETW